MKRATEPIDDLDVGLQIPISDIFDRIWRLFVSMRTGLALILGLAVLSLIGTLLVQAPPEVKADPTAYATWLDSIAPKYGGWTRIFDSAGFFSMFSSVWFRGVTVLLVTSIVACSIRRAPLLWRRAVHPRIAMGDSFFANAPLTTVFGANSNPEATLEAVRRVLRRRHLRVSVDSSGGDIHVHADRFRWGPWGTIAAHLSIISILVGAVIGATWGYRDNSLAVAVGNAPVAVGGGTGLTVAARSFSATYYPGGSTPSDYSSVLAVYRNGREVASQTVRVNQPLQVGDVAFHQAYFGGAVAMRVQDAAGKVLFDEAVPLLLASTDGKESVGRFSLPEVGATVYVVEAASGVVDPSIRAGQAKVEVYNPGSDQPAATSVVSQGQSAPVAGLMFTFVRERQFAGLMVARDPGAPLVWGGAVLLVLGIVLVFYFPHRRIWVRLRRDEMHTTEVRLASAQRRDAGFAAHFARIADDIKAAVKAAHTP